jgi:TATA-binding protein-associated factor Taf7
MTEAILDDGARRRTEALQAARKRDSQTKRAHVRSTVEKMLLAGDPVTFTTVARTARVSTWLVYAEGVREHIQAAIRQQADQPANHHSDEPTSMVSLRTDLALARDEITRLRGHNTKLRQSAQRLLGQQLDQVTNGDLLARVDDLVAENRHLTERLGETTRENGALRKQITELEEDVAAARTALRRMIREQSAGIADSALFE